MIHPRTIGVISVTILLSGSALSTAQTPAASVPRYEGLGSLARKVTTSSPEAQAYFNQGLAFL